MYIFQLSPNTSGNNLNATGEKYYSFLKGKKSLKWLITSHDLLKIVFANQETRLPFFYTEYQMVFFDFVDIETGLTHDVINWQAVCMPHEQHIWNILHTKIVAPFYNPSFRLVQLNETMKHTFVYLISLSICLQVQCQAGADTCCSGLVSYFILISVFFFFPLWVNMPLNKLGG